MLGTGVCGSRPRNGEIKWDQVVYQWCSGVGPVHLSERVIAMGWKQDEKWEGGGCSDTCKARENLMQILRKIPCFGGNSR